MTIDTTLKQFEHFGVKLGLEPIQRLLENLGNPHQRVPTIHVAGSNGKGSVCAYLSAVLGEAGYRVGRYTSPHLVDWCERICLNNQPITAAELEQTLQQVIAAIRPDAPSPTQFEVLTAAAWLYFAQQQVEIAVVEVGLGGRLDATNVCDCPLVTIITSLSLEHWQRLGPTLADIAREKAGILKPGCPAVIGPLPAEAATVVERRLAEVECPVLYPPAAHDHGGGWAEYAGIAYPLPLQGAVQLQNSALAIASLLILRQQGWNISDRAIERGMAHTHWAGRLQWVAWKGQPLLIDGAHNPASAAVLRQFVDGWLVQHGSTVRLHWVMGMLSTKDHADVFRELLRPGDRLFLVPVPDHSSADPEDLARLAQQVCPELAQCQVYPEVLAALEAAVELTENADQTTVDQVEQTEGVADRALTCLPVLCGSLYLIGHFFKVSGVPRTA